MSPTPSARLWRAGAAGLATVLIGSLAAAAPVPHTAVDPPPSATGAAGPADSLEVAQPDSGAQEEIDAPVQQALAAEGEADFFIGFDARADLSGATGIADWGERGAYVVEQLKRTAARSQRSVTATLDAAGAEYQSFWMANTILVEGGSPELAEQLVAERAVTRLHEPLAYDLPELLPADATAQADLVEWGIDAIGADRVWGELDVRGEEIVIANIDTGVGYDHPDLVDRYRGNRGDGAFDHDYHWFDPAGVCGPVPNQPCDNQDHGTHTMGTMLGGDAGDTAIGVAPGARWIAAKGCEATADVDCSHQALLASGQWTLAPTDRHGRDPRPELRPHIVNNSWGSHTGSARDPFYDQMIDAWTAAGVLAVFSNGNDGQRGCYTAGSPGDSPAAYSVGAYDINGELAVFSSRGPGWEGQIRPSIAAPGVAVRSSVPGGYQVANGTSMAAPHVAGAAALMWSAAPSLIGDVAGTRELLNQTAVDTPDLTCGGTPGNNNMFGEGRLDAYAAVSASPVGPTGTLTGTVTDAGTGEPVPDATVHAVGPDYQRSTATDAQGRYRTSLVAGEYELTVSGYGYEQRTVTGVEVAADAEAVADVALTALPSVLVSGTVTDGSGQGWPLYAGVSIAGYPHGIIYTDPITGRYEVELPASSTYTLTVAAEYEGYEPVTRKLTVGEDDLVLDATLTASAQECVAAGYRPAHHGLYQDFDAGELPAGWTVETALGDGWAFDDPGGRENGTGGEAGFASIDAAHGARREEGWLVSPVVDLSESAEPLVSFRTHLLMSRGVVEVDLSTDGGGSWENLWRRGATQRGPRLEQLPVPQAAGEPEVRVRFYYRNDIPSNGYWQVDQVLLGHRFCEPVPGGLVVGQVRDDRTGAGVNGATVHFAQRPEQPTTTVETPGDGAFDGGFYWLFSPETGGQELVAAHEVGQYAPATATAEVVAGAVVRADLALSSGEIELSTREVVVDSELGQARTATVTLTNSGTAPASYQLAERNGEFALSEAQRELLAEPGAPLRREPVTEPGVVLDPDQPAPAAPDPSETDWVRLHDAPTNWTNTLGAVHDGRLYVIGGSGGISQRNQVYDIAEDRWSWTGSFMPARTKPAGGFIGDRLYVVGGWGPPGSGAMSTTLIYDPATEDWSSGADTPYPVAAAGYAVLDGKLYVIGGRGGEDSDTPTAAMMVYDPASDAWSRVADYPEPASWQACGTIDGLIYCAGGTGDRHQHLSRAYVYHPAADQWYRIADLPRTAAAGGYTAANGLMLISGGRIGGYKTNEGFYYDPSTGGWAELPNALFPLERMASACGFYKVGGFLNPAIGSVRWVEQLPGFDQCDRTAGDRVPWLSAEPAAGTLAPGESVEVTLTLDARASGVDQPGDYPAWLTLLEDTPGDHQPVRVVMAAAAPDSWAAITGTVTGLARCDGPAEPVPGAVVSIDDVRGELARVRTDAEGRFTHWLDSYREGGHRPLPPLLVTAARDGWQAASERVLVRAGKTATVDFRLRRDEPCAGATPEEISMAVPAGEQASVPVRLDNRDGAAGYDYQVAATGYPLEPVSPAAAPEWADAVEIPLGVRNYAHAQCPGEPDLGYLIGGVDAALIEPTRKVWRYDAAADQWAELAPLPEPVSEAAAACQGGRIHVVGGTGSNRHYVYDVARDSWTEAAPLPQVRSEATAGIWNGQLYLAGGTNGEWSHASDRVYHYDPAADQWHEAAPMPVPARSPGAVQIGHHLYLVGGLDRTAGSPLLDTVQRLDLASGDWSLGPALALPRSGAAVAATDQAIYALGGHGQTEYGTVATRSVQRLPLADWENGAWDTEAVPELPVARANADAGFCTQGRAGGEIWSVGGHGGVERALFQPRPGEACPTLVTGVDWLATSVESGSVRAGGTDRFIVRIDARELDAGDTYRAAVLVTTTDPGMPEIRIPVIVTVE